jgi:pimeloyl-ACP methyl ester carboxylesterase
VSGPAAARSNARPRPGEDDARDVLLIHDQPGSPVIWSRVDVLLRSLGLVVHTVEWPGGRTRRPVAAAEADEIAQVLDRSVRRPIVVVGHDAGTISALALAAGAPRQIAAVVLVAPVPIPRSVRPTARTPRSRGPDVRVGCPAVLVTGARDPVSRPRAVDALIRCLPHTHRISTPTGHLIPLEDPDAVVQAVLHGLGRAYQQSLSPGGPHRPVTPPTRRTTR